MKKEIRRWVICGSSKNSIRRRRAVTSSSGISKNSRRRRRAVTFFRTIKMNLTSVFEEEQ